MRSSGAIAHEWAFLGIGGPASIPAYKQKVGQTLGELSVDRSYTTDNSQLTWKPVSPTNLSDALLACHAGSFNPIPLRAEIAYG